MASALSAKVLEKLKQIYRNQKILKEVPLSDFTGDVEFSESLKRALNHYDIRLKRIRIDFYVPGQVAIEVQGEQHEQEIRFSNEIENTRLALRRTRELDRVKQQVLAEAGIPQVCIWYYEVKGLTQDELVNKISVAQEETKVPTRRVQEPSTPRRLVVRPNRKISAPIKRKPYRPTNGRSRLSQQWKWHKEENRRDKNKHKFPTA